MRDAMSESSIGKPSGEETYTLRLFIVDDDDEFLLLLSYIAYEGCYEVNTNIGKPSGEETYILMPYNVLVQLTITCGLLRPLPSGSIFF